MRQMIGLVYYTERGAQDGAEQQEEAGGSYPGGEWRCQPLGTEEKK